MEKQLYAGEKIYGWRVLTDPEFGIVKQKLIMHLGILMWVNTTTSVVKAEHSWDPYDSM